MLTPAKLAAYPAGSVTGGQSSGRRWRRIDQAYGDRNLVCSCPPVSDYID